MPAASEARISTVGSLTLNPRTPRIQSRPQSNPFVNPITTERERVEGEDGDGEDARPPSRADEAPEWISPEERHNGESGWVHTIPGAGASEKVFVPSSDNVMVFPTTLEQESPQGRQEEPDPITSKKPRTILQRKYIIAISIVLAAIIIAVSLIIGLVLGSALSRRQNSSSSAQPQVTAVNGIATSMTGVSSSLSSTMTTATADTISTRSVVSTITVLTSSRTAAAQLNLLNNHAATVGIAPVQSGSATGLVTLSSFSEPDAAALQTVGVFHSSAFSPSAFVSSITYSAAPPGATEGIGIVDCPVSDGTRYVAGNGAIFQKHCYADVADAKDVSSTTATSLEDCIEACVQNFSPSKRGVDGVRQCQSLAYSANITLAFGQQGANCWFKEAIGVPSAGDWQQSTASFIGWLADSE